MPAQQPAPQSSTSGAPSSGGFSEDLHPRGPGGKFATKNGSKSQGLSSATRKAISDYQRKHGLPVTGVPDARTIAAAKAQAAAPKQAREQAAAAKKAASASKRATAKRVAVQKKAQAAILARKHAEARALVSSVNRLDDGQRETYRQAVGNAAPQGYAWTADNRLVSSERARSDAAVAAKAGPATSPKAKAAAARKAPGRPTPKPRPTPTPAPSVPARRRNPRHQTMTSRKGGVITTRSGTA